MEGVVRVVNVDHYEYTFNNIDYDGYPCLRVNESFKPKICFEVGYYYHIFNKTGKRLVFDLRRGGHRFQWIIEEEPMSIILSKRFKGIYYIEGLEGSGNLIPLPKKKGKIRSGVLPGIWVSHSGDKINIAKKGDNSMQIDISWVQIGRQLFNLHAYYMANVPKCDQMFRDFRVWFEQAEKGFSNVILTTSIVNDIMLTATRHLKNALDCIDKELEKLRTIYDKIDPNIVRTFTMYALAFLRIPRTIDTPLDSMYSLLVAPLLYSKIRNTALEGLAKRFGNSYSKVLSLKADVELRGRVNKLSK